MKNSMEGRQPAKVAILDSNGQLGSDLVMRTEDCGFPRGLGQVVYQWMIAQRSLRIRV